jgi:hypothetical protein
MPFLKIGGNLESAESDNFSAEMPLIWQGKFVNIKRPWVRVLIVT